MQQKHTGYSDIDHQLHDILRQRPSPLTWSRLCQELDQWGSFTLFTTRVEERLLTVLSRWPDELRLAPKSWVDLLLHGEVPLGISLVRTLEIDQEISDAIWLKLLNHPALAHLSCLKLDGVTFSARRARQLAQSSTLTRLKRLDIERTTLCVEALAQLLSPRATWTGSLRELALSNCNLELEHMRLLSSSALIERIESLDISKNRLDPLELRALFRDTKLTALNKLMLSFNQIGEMGLRELLAHDCVRNLSHLDLYANALPERALEALLESTHLEAMTSLSLGLNRFTSALANHTLPASPMWHSPQGMTHLNMDFVQTFEPGTFRALGTQGQLDHLEHLSLSGCMLDDESIHTLVEHHTLPHMNKLELNLNAISSHGLHSLCSAHLPRLDHLVLSHNAIDAHAANVLPHASWIPHTSYMDLRANLISEKLRERLAQTPSLMLVDTLLL